jgi:hypothetical protein
VVKDFYPIELAEFAKALGIADEPAFAWWAPHTLRRRNVILSTVRARVWKKTHKYGIEDKFGPGQGDGQNQLQYSVDGCSQVGDAQCSFEVLKDGKIAPQG